MGRMDTCMWLHTCSVVSDFLHPMDWDPPGSSVHGVFQARNTGVGCHFLLQGIFLTQGLNLHLLRLLHWQADSLLLHYLGSPYFLQSALNHHQSSKNQKVLSSPSTKTSTAPSMCVLLVQGVTNPTNFSAAVFLVAVDQTTFTASSLTVTCP